MEEMPMKELPTHHFQWGRTIIWVQGYRYVENERPLPGVRWAGLFMRDNEHWIFRVYLN